MRKPERVLWGPYAPFDHYSIASACTCTVQYQSGKGTFRYENAACPIHGMRVPVSVSGGKETQR